MPHFIHIIILWLSNLDTNNNKIKIEVLEQAEEEPKGVTYMVPDESTVLYSEGASHKRGLWSQSKVHSKRKLPLHCRPLHGPCNNVMVGLGLFQFPIPQLSLKQKEHTTILKT